MGAPNRLNYPEEDRPQGRVDPHAPGRRLNEVPNPPEQRRLSRGFWVGVIVFVALLLFGVALFLSGLKQAAPTKAPQNQQAAPPGVVLLP